MSEYADESSDNGSDYQPSDEDEEPDSSSDLDEIDNEIDDSMFDHNDEMADINFVKIRGNPQKKFKDNLERKNMDKIDARITYDKRIDSIDPLFSIANLSPFFQKIYANIIAMLTHRKNTNISVNNLYSITSDQTRVQFVNKINLQSLRTVATDPMRKTGLDLIADSKINTTVVISEILKIRRSYGEHIRIWNVKDFMVNTYEGVKYVNGCSDNAVISLITRKSDPTIYHNLAITGPFEKLPIILPQDPLVKWLAGNKGEIIEIDNGKTGQISYRRIDKP